MKYAKYICTLAAAASMAACSNNEPTYISGDSNEVTIAATVGNDLKSRTAPAGTSAAEQSAFSNGDKIVVSDGTSIAIYALNGIDWAAQGEALKCGDTYPVTYKAYYPATAGVSMTTFSLPTDQSTTAKIAEADYMTIETELDAMPSGGRLALEFNRRTARVIINVTGVDKVLGGSVSSVVVTSASNAIPTNTTTADITPYNAGNKYYALVVPAEANDAAVFVKITTANGTVKTATGIPALEAGKSYTYNTYIGDSGIYFSDVTVSDWNTGGTIVGDLSDVTDELNTLYVMPEATGAKTGADFENAIGVDELVEWMKSRYCADMTFVLGEGTFYIPVYLDITDRNVGLIKGQGQEKTIIKPNMDNRPGAWEFFYPKGTTKLSFEDITFEGLASFDNATTLACFVLRDNNELNLTRCTVRNFNPSARGSGGEWDGRGAAIMQTQYAKVRAAYCTFSDCRSTSRGIIALSDNNVSSWFKNCVFHRNYSNNWGVVFHTSGGSDLAMVNCSLDENAGVTNDCMPINGDGNMFIASSTVFNSNPNAKVSRLIRYNQAGTRTFVNNLIYSANANTYLIERGDAAANAHTDLGYSVIGERNFNLDSFAWPETTVRLTEVLPFTASNGIIDWTIPAQFTQYTTVETVRAAAKAYNADFAAWVGDDFGMDINGNPRNASILTPGALQK